MQIECLSVFSQQFLASFTKSMQISKIQYIAAGSEDTVIKVVDILKTAEPFELCGHEGPVLHIDLHPLNEWLASAGGDGTIRIWDLQTKKELKCIRGLEKTKTFETAKTFSKFSNELHVIVRTHNVMIMTPF